MSLEKEDSLEPRQNWKLIKYLRVEIDGGKLNPNLEFKRREWISDK